MYCPSRDLAEALTKNALMPGRLECHTWDLVMRAITGALGPPYKLKHHGTSGDPRPVGTFHEARVAAPSPAVPCDARKSGWPWR